MHQINCPSRRLCWKTLGHGKHMAMENGKHLAMENGKQMAMENGKHLAMENTWHRIGIAGTGCPR